MAQFPSFVQRIGCAECGNVIGSLMLGHQFTRPTLISPSAFHNQHGSMGGSIFIR